MKPTPYGLVRHSTGLSPAHIELIKMLAARAVADYLAETEAEPDQEEEPASHEPHTCP